MDKLNWLIDIIGRFFIVPLFLSCTYDFYTKKIYLFFLIKEACFQKVIITSSKNDEVNRFILFLITLFHSLDGCCRINDNDKKEKRKKMCYIIIAMRWTVLRTFDLKDKIDCKPIKFNFLTKKLELLNKQNGQFIIYLNFIFIMYHNELTL